VALTVELLPIETKEAYYQGFQGGTYVHEALDDPVGEPDEWSSNVAGNLFGSGAGGAGDNASLKLRFAFEPLPVASSIASVTLVHRSRYGGTSTRDGVRWRPFLYVNGTQYNGDLITLTNSFTDYSQTWETNPRTNAPWSPADVNQLEGGVLDNNDAGTGSGYPWVFRVITQIYLRVVFDALPPNLLVMREVATRFMLDYCNPRNFLEFPADLVALEDDLMGYVDVSHPFADSPDAEGWGDRLDERHMHETQSIALNLDTLIPTFRGLDVRHRMLRLYDTGVARLGYEADAQGVGRLDVGGTRLFSRDSAAWVEDANGVVHLIGSNVEKLEGLGMLLENESTNYVLQSSFTNELDGWTTSGNVVTDPDDVLLFEPSVSAFSMFFAGYASPDEIEGVKLWLEADTLSLSDDDPVETWEDLGPLGYHATQPDATRRPRYETAAINGLPVVRFEGNQFLQSTISSAILSADACTIFVVAIADAITTNNSATATNNTIYGDGDDDGGGSFGAHLKSAGPTVHSYLSDGADRQASKAIVIGTPFIHTFHHSGGILYSGVDDTRTASMSSQAAGNIASVAHAFRIGTNQDLADRFFTGRIALIVACDPALTEAVRVHLEGFFSAKYGITAGSATVMTAQQTLADIAERYCTFSADHRDGAANAGFAGYALQRPADSKWFRASDQTWQVAETTNTFAQRTTRTRDVSPVIDFGSAPISGAVLKLVSTTARDAIHWSHIQLEGLRWATSRIPNEDEAKTRLMESLEYENSADHTLFPAEHGTLWFYVVPEFNATDMTAAGGTPVLATIVFSSNHSWTFRYNAGALELVARVAGVDYTASVPWTAVRGTKYAIAARWTANDGALGLDPFTITVGMKGADDLGYMTEASLTLAALPTETLGQPFFLGGNDVDWAANGWVSQVHMYPFPLTRDELARLPL